MKKLFCILVSAIIATLSFAETQQGIVKTRGRMDANGNIVSGERLDAVTVTIKNSSSYITNNKGTFSFTVPSQTFYIANVQKNGYQLCDNDVLNRGLQYSANPLVLVMETPDNTLADRLAAEKKIRRTLQRQLQENEDKIDALKEQQKITDEQYRKQLQALYADQEKNEILISEMAERYSTLDFDLMDEYQLQVAFFIQNGELTRADSLLNTKGSMEERSAEIDRLRSANRKEREDIEKRQANLIQSDSLASKLLEDFAADCYSHYEICKLQHKNDSAAYWLELRASKDTTNGEWQVDCGIFILNYQANYTLAQTYMERALNIVNNNPDFSDDSRGSCFANLADVYLKCGQYNEAINMYTRALCLHSKKSEEYVAATVGLANCYEIISENKKAADCLREAYSVYQQMNYHTPEILLRIYNQLATNLVKRGNFEEAQKFLNLSLELAENDEAIDLPRQIIVYFDAASFYREMNKYEESESLLKKALEVSLVIYEDKHPTISSIYNGLGVLYYNLSNMENAIYYLLKAKDCHTNNRDNEQYAQVCSNIAGIYLREGKLDLSEQYEIEAYNIRVKIFGEDSPAMFNQYNALTALYCEKGEYEKGLGYVEKAIALIKREAGEMHPSLNASYSYVGGINMRLGRLEEALKWFKLALDVSKHYYGNEHTETADAYSNIGGISLYLKRYDEAIDMLKESLRIHIAVYGEKHVDVAADYNGLAQTYMAMGNYQDAISNFEKAIDIRKEVFGNNSVKLKPLYGFMIEIYQKLGDVKKAESYSKLLDAIQE